MILKFKDEAIYIKPNGEYISCSPSQKEDDWTTTPQLDYYNDNCRGMYCQAHVTEVEENNNLLFNTLQVNETTEVERGEKRVYLPVTTENFNEMISGDGESNMIIVGEKSDGTIYTLGSQRNNNKVSNPIDEYKYNSETGYNAIIATIATSNHDIMFPDDSIPNETVPLEFIFNDDEQSFYIKNRITQNYLYSPGGGNYLRESTLEEIDNEYTALWHIENSETPDLFIINSIDGEIEQNYLKFNKNNRPPLFSCYKESAHDFNEVKLFYDPAYIAEVNGYSYYLSLTNVEEQTYSDSIDIECYIRNVENWRIDWKIYDWETDVTVKIGSSNEEIFTIDLSDIPNGDYYIELYYSDNSVSEVCFYTNNEPFTVEGHTPPEPPTPTPTDEAIFVLPFRDSAQGELDEATYHDDVQIFNQIDLGLISYNELQERYSSNNFFDNELWSFICDNDLVDETATNKVINSLYAKYSTKNEQVYIKDLTIDELKNFRTWLATTLYNDYNEENARLEELNSEVTDMMLKYYANNMYDDVIKALTKLGQNSVMMKDFLKAYGVFSPNTIVSNIGGTGIDIMTKPTGNMVNVVTGKTVMALPGSTSKCGCSGSLNMYDMGLSACDCVEIYRKNVYAQMVSDFSNIDFWKNRSEILSDFIKYIEGIINNNFTLGYSEHSTLYCDCSCNSSNDQQEANMTILRNLLKALQYIYNEVEEDSEGEGLSGHKNFVSESLNKWAVILYEKMQWI